MMNYLSAELESNALKSNTEEEDKIYDEMTKLTRSTVDRYLDKIILDILYKSALAVAEKETEQQLGDAHFPDRRSSASDAELRQLESGRNCGNLEIKRRLKELQKSHLIEAHEALVTVLSEIKDTVEVTNESGANRLLLCTYSIILSSS